MRDPVLITLLICATFIILGVVGTIDKKQKESDVKLANVKNLKPVQSKDEARKKGRAGGIASGKARRERKTLKEELLTLLKTGDNQKKISIALLARALDGSTKAFEVIRDTIGEKPKDEIVVENPNATKVLESINSQLKK